MQIAKNVQMRRQILGQIREMTDKERGKLFDRILDTWCMTCADKLNEEGYCEDCEEDEDEEYEDEDTDDEEGDDSPPDEDEDEDEDEGEPKPEGEGVK